MKYTGDNIVIDRTDIENIRKLPQMYGYIGNKGYIHMMKEVLQNSIDEAPVISPRKCNINIIYNDITKEITISDNGRGIPIDRVVHVFTKLHTSGKSGLNGDNSAYGITSGVHGVGIKYTNALSDYLLCAVERDGEKHEVSFKKGEIDKDIHKTGKSSKTGTSITFKPDFSILSKVSVTVEEMIDAIETLSYLSYKGTTVTLSIVNKKGIEKLKYINKDGEAQLLDKYKSKMNVDKYAFKPMRFSKKEGDISVDILFTFANIDGANVESYCNYCNTVEGGYHVDAFTSQLSYSIKKLVEDNLNDKEKKKYKVTLNDCKEGLFSVVNAFHPKPILEGQTKEKVGQEDFVPFIKESFKEFFIRFTKDKANRAIVSKIVNVVKANVSARVKSHELKNSFIKEEKDSSTFFNKPAKLKPATGNGYKEIFLVEGDSAMGSATERDTKTQAIYPFRGVLLSTIEKTTAEILKNKEISELISALGCNIGPKFDINKLKYDKIIIMTDADVDGGKISSLICCLFATHLPEIIEKGLLYRTIPPLYGMVVNGSKNKKFVATYREYLEYIVSKISDSYEIEVMDGVNSQLMSKSEVINLLAVSKEYLTIINKNSRKFSLEPELIEDLIYIHKRDNKFKKKYIESKYPYLNTGIDKGNFYIDGVFNKTYHYECIDGEEFKYRFDDMIQEMEKVNYNIHYKLNGKETSLYKALSEFSKFKPKDIQRYKGLGEMNPEQLYETTMCTDNRTLIKFTMEDIEEAMKGLQVLHGQKKLESKNARKRMMEVFKITRDQIDN